MTERPFYEAEILMLVCLYFPYNMRPESVSSVLAVRASRVEELPVQAGIVHSRKKVYQRSLTQEAE